MSGGAVAVLVFLAVLALALLFAWMLDRDIRGRDEPSGEARDPEDTIDIFDEWRKRRGSDGGDEGR